MHDETRRHARYSLLAGCSALALLAATAVPERARCDDYVEVRPSSIGGLFASSNLARTAAAQTDDAISARIRSLRRGGESMLAAVPDRRIRLFEFGNGGAAIGAAETRALAAKEGIDLRDMPLSTPLGVWVDGAWSNLSFDDNGSSYSGEMWSGLMGLDFEVDDGLVVGLAGRFENQNFDTGTGEGAISGSGAGLAPYLVYDLNDGLSLDFSGGYSWIDYADTHLDSATGALASGDTLARRWFGSTHLNFSYPVDRWRFDGRVGSLYAGQGVDEPLTGAVAGDQLMAVGDLRIGYVFDVFGGLEPYISALSHFTARDGADRSADGTFRLGSNLDFHGGATLRIEGSTSETNSADADNYAGQINLRIPL